jgi:hypoxanthine phosphoribosyltransferase
METINILDKTFRISISSQKIAERINQLADEINHDLKSKEVVFIGILNGAFVFASDLLRHVNLACQVTFLKISSYKGVQSSGFVNHLIGLNDDLNNKTVVIIEDIIETGKSLHSAIDLIKEQNPAEIKVAGLLFKPDSYTFDHRIDYIGFTIPNNFVVGFGLDYNGFGRNLSDLYTIIEL